MRAIRRLYYFAHEARTALARFYVAEAMVPIFAAACAASGILVATGLASHSPSTIFVGAIVAALMVVAVSVGRGAFLADVRETRATHASNQHAYEVASRALREAFRSMSDRTEGE